ncbi:MAG TPA: hypothetical protein VFR55_04245 [Dehalococcoidia bacterium]|nr:hypothetical protein [Dehalococcoidia bacterium]
MPNRRSTLFLESTPTFVEAVVAVLGTLATVLLGKAGWDRLRPQNNDHETVLKLLQSHNDLLQRIEGAMERMEINHREVNKALLDIQKEQIRQQRSPIYPGGPS